MSVLCGGDGGGDRRRKAQSCCVELKLRSIEIVAALDSYVFRVREYMPLNTWWIQ